MYVPRKHRLQVLAHFSQNYGWSTLAPVLGGNAFNLLFGELHGSVTTAWDVESEEPDSASPFTNLPGRVYDSNTQSRIGAPPPHRGGGGSETNRHIEAAAALLSRAGVAEVDVDGQQCLLGASCYATAFKISALGCLVALGLSIYAGLRRERKSAERRRLV